MSFFVYLFFSYHRHTSSSSSITTTNLISSGCPPTIRPTMTTERVRDDDGDIMKIFVPIALYYNTAIVNSDGIYLPF